MKRNYTIKRGALDGVEAFLAVARLTSFRRAAAELGVTPSAVSQAIRGLEEAVGAPLFARTTRSVGLTQAGARFDALARPAFDQLLTAREAAREVGARPTGLLRIAVPRAVVPLILEPVIASFCSAYPEVELEIAASEEMVDIAGQHFDADIRMGQLIAADMVAIRLTPPFPFVAVGSPAYLAANGTPQTPADLRGHACIRIRRANGAAGTWPFRTADGTIEAVVSGPLIAHDYPTALSAARQGVGLAQVPAPIVLEAVRDGRLVRLLEPFELQTPGVFLYHPGRRQVLPKLRAFIDHVTRVSFAAAAGADPAR